MLSALVWIPVGVLVHMLGERLPRSAGGGVTGQELRYLKTARGCTLDNCIDWSKCRNSTSFYIYGESEGNIESAVSRHFGSRREIYRFVNKIERTLRTSPFINVVDDPAKACFFVPRLACLSVGKCDLYEGFSEARLKALPHWNQGRNHVLVDYADDRFAKIYGAGAEIHIRSASSVQYFRENFDVGVPLRAKMSLYSRVVKSEGKPSGERPYLLSFRGSLTDESTSFISGTAMFTRGGAAASTHTHLRRQLASLHNGEDILIQVKHLDRSRLKDDNYWRDYGTLLLNSKFQLVPRGKGLHSHRFLESLAAGSIPVVLADGIVLPFAGMIDWRKAAIQIPEAEWERIPTILRSLPEQKVQEMQCNCLFIYRNFFMRPGGSLEIAFRTLQKRIAEHPNFEGNEAIPSVLRDWPPEEVNGVPPPAKIDFCENREQ